jgi:hypothetical protein
MTTPACNANKHAATGAHEHTRPSSSDKADSNCAMYLLFTLAFSAALDATLPMFSRVSWLAFGIGTRICTADHCTSTLSQYTALLHPLAHRL